MAVISLKILGLNGSKHPIDLAFHRDVNIFTGRNGAGKTTLLKSLWYGLSGNIEHLIREVVFDSYELRTDKFTLVVERKEMADDPREIVSFSIQLLDSEGRSIVTKKTESKDRIERGGGTVVNVANRTLMRFSTSSVFFPTFRRIEGGFGIGEADPRYPGAAYGSAPSSHMQEALQLLSSHLSTPRHQFVASISTSDLKVLLNTRYAALSNKVNADSELLLQEIFSLVRDNETSPHRQAPDALEASKKTLDAIKNAASAFEQRRESIFAPFEVLLKLVHKMLLHKGVRLTDTLVAGDAASAIDSTKLSAGEKQLLSFLCYNAFTANSAIFIDEPELSLHIDWQRVLVATLTSQQPENQFFVATHSPFIYSQYADKEVLMAEDRGFSMPDAAPTDLVKGSTGDLYDR